ncbi:MAG TPA: hypothetical protein PK447_04105 [Ignavibacteria bacterium]|nr:hypothetical protein [Ignavibacteria bacterium]
MRKAVLYFLLLIFILALQSCNYVTHRTYLKSEISDEEDPEPVYDITLDEDYQNFTEFMFMGNRSENFSTYFNKYFTALENFNDGMKDYEQTFIANYNPSLDSLGSLPPASSSSKEKFTKVIETCSKIIQYNKNTRYFDKSVLLIGKSYYYQQDYLQSERKFNEFISKLSKSSLYDEAILYLGRSKIRLRKINDAEKILNDLLAKTQDNDIKSDITEELANISLYRHDYKGAVDFLEKSVNFTNDKNKKARKQYVLAKIFLLNDPVKAAAEYDLVLKNTSDFDLTFYAKLNKYISLNKAGKFNETLSPLEDMTSKYRDYPELRQLAEYEYANTLFNQKKYPEAINKYYDIILDYAGTKTASNSYYHLGYYYEIVKHDYFNALINYKRAATITGLADFTAISNKKYTDFDKYFTLLAQIHDTTKIIIPDENPELENYRKQKLKEKGKEKQNDNGLIKEGKGQGWKFLDTIKNPPKHEVSPDQNRLPEDKTVIKNKTKDTTVLHKDTIPKVIDTLTHIDSVNRSEIEMMKKIHTEDSIKSAKQQHIYDGYFELAELFLFGIEQRDSSEKYLNYLLTNDTLSSRRVKTLFMMSNIYREKPDLAGRANELLEIIIKKYPNTEIANEARRQLGQKEITIEKDSSDVIYNSAADLLSKKYYKESLDEFKKIIFSYPESPVYQKSLYAVGFIYENNIPERDSAFKYYKILIDKFPESEYAAVVQPKVMELITYKQSDSTAKSKDTTGVRDSLELISKDSARYVIDSLITNPTDTVSSAPGNNVLQDTLKPEILPPDTTAAPPQEVPKQEKDGSTYLMPYSHQEYCAYLRKMFYLYS